MLFGMPNLLSQESGHVGMFEQTSHDARQLWDAILDIPKENTVFTGDQEILKDEEAIQKIANTAATLGIGCDPSQRAVIRFLQTTATSLLKKRSFDAADCFIYTDEIVMGMEYFQMRQGIPAFYAREGQSTVRLPMVGIVNHIFPIRGTQILNRINAMGFQRIRSLVCPDGIPEVSSLFRDLGDYDKAWRASLESAYFDKSPNLSDRSRNGDRNVLSTKNAVRWHDAAESAYRAGERDLAWGFLMKAAVFGDERLYATTLETAKLWIDVEDGTTELPKPELLTPEERKRKFKEIVLVYKNMNIHPRAWAIIDEYWEEFDDPDGLKKEIQDDWLELTNLLFYAATRAPVGVIVLYGYNLLVIGGVAEDGTRLEIRQHDPLDVKIPWIYPDGWQENTQKMHDEIMRRLGVSPDRFRTWHTDSGATSFVAKFVSWIDDKVTLEKEDGTSITVALGDFMMGDQNFIRHCFEMIVTDDNSEL